MKERVSFARTIALIFVSVFTGVSFTACGKQAFQVTPSDQQQQAPGTATIPPKVDVLLAEDDTGSMFEPYNQISSQVTNFLSTLDGENWDYHFTTVPLTTDRRMSQVVASKYDGNSGANWVAPYPGAQPYGPGTVSPSVFQTVSSYTGFVSQGDINNSLNGLQPGLDNIVTALSTREPGTGFKRTDSLFVVIVLTNGDDTSKVNICQRSDGFQGPCGLAGAVACSASANLSSVYSPGIHAQHSDGTYDVCATEQLARAYFENQLRAQAPNSANFKFYSVAAANRSSSCGTDSNGNPVGANAGNQYNKMAPDLGGQSYDICSSTLSTVLSSIGANLQAQRLNYRTRYLFIDKEPNVASIIVTKYVGGSSAASQIIPEDPANGWTYAGYVTNVYAIDSPVPMNVSSGYAIELHGNAKLLGNDTANVSFKPAGASDSETN